MPIDRDRRRVFVEAFLVCASPALAQAPAVMQVGPRRAVRTLAEAARKAVAGQRIEVDAGEYRGDTAVWQRDGLSLQAAGGRVRMVAEGRSAQGKALFVTSGTGLSIQGFDFEGVEVTDHNGAGIRLESGTLSVEDCRFLDSECGIITGNHAGIRLDIRHCEFGHQRRADGRNHLLYAGSIARLSVIDCHFHHAKGGHLIKSRALVHEILRNRLVDGPGGQASYELEFPNGGFAIVVGNIIDQAGSSENPTMVSFGAEGYREGEHALTMVHNTLVNRRPGHLPWVHVYPGKVAALIRNNLWAGLQTQHVLQGIAQTEGQLNTAIPISDLANPDAGDYRLRRASTAWGRATLLPDPALRPPQQGTRLQPGAVQAVAE